MRCLKNVVVNIESFLLEGNEDQALLSLVRKQCKPLV